MIPKILHQVWLGPNPIPDEFLIWKDQWKNLHPDWTYMLHTDKDVPEHLKHYVDSCSHFSSKSNIMRLYVVNKYGGVYCDTDFEWNKNIDCFLDNDFIVAKQQLSVYCNAFFGSVANNEVLNWQLDQIKNYYTRSPPWGPGLLTLAVEKYTSQITILPTKYVYPYLWDKPFTPACNFPDAYLVHHWRKSWGKK
jgi:mannosyltransferase OCH1-like enzyme